MWPQSSVRVSTSWHLKDREPDSHKERFWTKGDWVRVGRKKPGSPKASLAARLKPCLPKTASQNFPTQILAAIQMPAYRA